MNAPTSGPVDNPQGSMPAGMQEATTQMQPVSAPGDEVPPGSPGAAEGLCPACGGSGRVADADCSNCMGIGKVSVGVGGG